MTDTVVKNGKRRTSRVRLYAALLSGAVASGANMALLGTASAAGITTAHGGLLLPLTGEGIAGSAHLNAIGMISFATAHVAFFEVLSVLYGYLFLEFPLAAAGRSSCFDRSAEPYQ
jgi:hypothetical protein